MEDGDLPGIPDFLGLWTGTAGLQRLLLTDLGSRGLNTGGSNGRHDLAAIDEIEMEIN